MGSGVAELMAVTWVMFDLVLKLLSGTRIISSFHSLIITSKVKVTVHRSQKQQYSLQDKINGTGLMYGHLPMNSSKTSTWALTASWIGTSLQHLLATRNTQAIL